MKIIIAAILLATGAGPALAQDKPCAQAAVTPGFEGWANKASASTPAIGRQAMLALSPAESVAFQPAPARAPMAGSFGGMFPIEIATAGTYRIALGGKAWIDVVRDGTRLVSSAHQEGVACSGITKIVAFDLMPGRYVIQLSEAKAANIALMIAPAI